MRQVVIDDPNGFETVFSTNPMSPAAPYLREYRPRSLEDLYDIGIIPKHVPVETLRTAREVGRQAGGRHMDIASPAVHNLPAWQRRQYVEARSNTMARDASLRAMAGMLITQHGYEAAEAALLANKVYSFDATGVEEAPIQAFMAVLLDADLIVRTPLVIHSNIHSIMAKSVVIYRTGEIRAEGGYFLLVCDSIRGEFSWGEALANYSSNSSSAAGERMKMRR